MNRILVVCVGNICRSPVGERVLQSMLPGFHVYSAGIGALLGEAADETAAAVAARHGVSLEEHVAQQFTPDIASCADLILVMEPKHKQAITSSQPQLSGKVMLFDQWTGAQGIADPFRRSAEFHENVFSLIQAAAEAWAQKLFPNR